MLHQTQEEKPLSRKHERTHFLSDEEYEEAKSEQLNFQTAYLPFKAPHFVLYVRQLLADKFGEVAVQQGGLQITTSLDLPTQEMPEATVFDEIEKAKYLDVGNGGLVAMDPKSGQILAMVGPKGYFLKSEPDGCISGTTGENSCTFEPNLNVTLARRQPGSSIKPITYATLLSKGYTAAFPFLDVPTSFPGSAPDKPYNPVNYDGRFRGPMSLRKSLGNSLNNPAVKALKRLTSLPGCRMGRHKSARACQWQPTGLNGIRHRPRSGSSIFRRVVRGKRRYPW